MKRILPTALVLLVAAMAGAAPRQAKPELVLPPPMPRALTEALQRVPPDPEPEHLAADVHFPTSNEQQHYLWHDAIEESHGIFVGVGTDQNYVMAGWAKPDVLVLMDFDQVVTDLHLIYRSVFCAASTPQRFRALWGWSHRKEVIALLEKDLTEKATRERVIKSFLEFRPHVEARLKQLLETYQEQKLRTFLDDPAQYQYLVALFKSKQVLPIRGDLTADRALRGVAELAHRMKIPVRVLYLSNAERYFKYTPDFKANILALPMDGTSVVLRTAGFGSSAAVDPYYYITQNGLSFQEWLRDGDLPAVGAMLTSLKPLGKPLTYEVLELAAAREKQAAREPGKPEGRAAPSR